MLPYVLAQATSPNMQDLKFLRMPEGTQEGVIQVLWVLLLIVGTVVVTIVLQRIWSAWVASLPSKKSVKQKAGPRLSEKQQAALDLLRFYTEPLKLNHVLTDARVFETAVEKALMAASDEDLADITALRRHMRMTVMNHDIAVVSTRQLLESLPVRLIVNLGDERLDLYCSMLDVNERFMLIDLPYHEDIYKLLMRHPRVTLVYWHEETGEALFDITLEAIQQGDISMFRAQHVLRDEHSSQRADFRLSVDIPVHYACVTKEQLAKHKETGAQFSAIKGEGRIIDLSHGGGALITQQPLPEEGIAQLNFKLEDQPVRMMLQVLTAHPAEGGKHMARGKFRGAQPDSRSRLEAFITREQLSRLRNKETVFTKMVG
ncbi:MAG TPA: PilZ domain-containing protein [bacterium]